MEITPFAGLTALDEDDPITTDGGSFMTKNPRIIDKLLRVGCVTHRHDGAGTIAEPTEPMTGVVLPSAGLLPGGATYALTYTWTDTRGGETVAAPPLVLAAPDVLDAPTNVLVAAPDYTQGIMPAGYYYYAQTYTDGAGGETAIGPMAEVYLEPGHASGAVHLSDLSLELNPASGVVDYRLWRSYEGEDWRLATQDTADTYLDTGFDPPDNPARPPDVSTMQGNNALQVDVPPVPNDGTVASARIYLAADVGFPEPCFYIELASGDVLAGATLTITDDTVSTGSPPREPTTVMGAHQIFPDDELQFGFKMPVDTRGLLPAGVQGDVRVVLDEEHIYGVLVPIAAGADDWVDLTPTKARVLGTYFTDVLASGASGAVSWDIGKCATVVQVQSDRAARVRLYSNPDKRDADAARAIGADPPPNSGLVLELVIDAGDLVYDLSPAIIAYSTEGSSFGALGASSNIAGAVTNLGADGPVAVNIVKYPVEA